MITPTEQRNPRTHAIDAVGTVEILRMVNEEDGLVAGAVRAVIPHLCLAVDAAVEAVRGGGRVHYFGAGTSGRLAVLDAAELLSTFRAPADLVIAHHAGGMEALMRTVENAEDSEESGAEDASGVGRRDIALGIAASGSTPYVAGALRAARSCNATTALVTSDPAAPLAALADIVIAPDTGPEAIAGSTRLKAGTAQKMILNSFSTALMVQLGHTWSNLMVNMVATNRKLRGRMLRILADASGADAGVCKVALEASGGELKPALVHLLTGCNVTDARLALRAADGRVGAALQELDRSS